MKGGEQDGNTQRTLATRSWMALPDVCKECQNMARQDIRQVSNI